MGMQQPPQAGYGSQQYGSAMSYNPQQQAAQGGGWSMQQQPVMGGAMQGYGQVWRLLLFDA